MAWSSKDIPDQSGRTVIVTGANGGIGKVTATTLARRGAKVVMACRNVAAGQQIAERAEGDIQVAALDLADLASIRAFADTIETVDVLINNAGVMNIPFSRTKDGFETQWGINHLGHFALTGLLLDRLGDRVVTVSSIAHRQTPRLWTDDLDYHNRSYRRQLAYAQSKLANLMFARELQRRLTEADSKKRSYAVHPGVAATNLFTHTETPADAISKPFVALIGHSPTKAAESSLYAATSVDANPTTFWGPTWLFGARGPVGAAPSTKLSQDQELWRRLWEESERLTGITYTFTTNG